MERPRELLHVAEARLGRERAEHDPDVLKMLRTGPADGVLEARGLEQNVDERAPLEVVAVEPLVEEIEDREQAVLRGRTTLARLRLHPAVRPDMLALAEKGQHEVVLRREVAVEGRLRDRGPLDHLFDADGADSAP